MFSNRMLTAQVFSFGGRKCALNTQAVSGAENSYIKNDIEICPRGPDHLTSSIKSTTWNGYCIFDQPVVCCHMLRPVARFTVHFNKINPHFVSPVTRWWSKRKSKRKRPKEKRRRKNERERERERENECDAISSSWFRFLLKHSVQCCIESLAHQGNEMNNQWTKQKKRKKKRRN